MPRLAILHVWVLTLWITGLASGCSDLQSKENGLCCDLCPPGTYMKDFCSKDHQTICSPCGEGFFSHQYHAFDRCSPCQECSQEYAEKCNATTNAKCSCRLGFLCSDSLCSGCVENKCEMGDTPVKVSSSTGRMNKYTYECKPSCPENSYFDAGICKVRALCGVLGLAELFPGNKTHNSVCEKLETQQEVGDSAHMLLAFGCAFLSVTLLLVLSYIWIKSLRKHRARKQNYKTATPAVAANTDDYHLSKEESGHMLIIQDESKDSSSFC